MFVQLFLISKTWKPPMCVSAGKHIKVTRPHCGVVPPGSERNAPLIHAATWVQLQIVLSERSQTQVPALWFHLCDVLAKAKVQAWKSSHQLPGFDDGEVGCMRTQIGLGRCPIGQVE